jgi:hypothetical protein
MLAPKTSDWVGTWYHPGGSIEIKSGKRDILDVEGGMRADRKRFSQWRVQSAGYTQERHCGVCRRRHELRRRMPRAAFNASAGRKPQAWANLRAG